MNVCLYAWECVHVYSFFYLCNMYLSTYVKYVVCMHVCMYECIYVCEFMFVGIKVCICVYVYRYVGMYVCIHVCMHRCLYAVCIKGINIVRIRSWDSTYHSTLNLSTISSTKKQFCAIFLCVKVYAFVCTNSIVYYICVCVCVCVSPCVVLCCVLCPQMCE